MVPVLGMGRFRGTEALAGKLAVPHVVMDVSGQPNPCSRSDMVSHQACQVAVFAFLLLPYQPVQQPHRLMGHQNHRVREFHPLARHVRKILELVHVDVFVQSQVHAEHPPAVRELECKEGMLLRHQPPADPTLVAYLAKKRIQTVEPVVVARYSKALRTCVIPQAGHPRRKLWFLHRHGVVVVPLGSRQRRLKGCEEAGVVCLNGGSRVRKVTPDDAHVRSRQQHFQFLRSRGSCREIARHVLP
mmetsp:Transcript_14971/g.28792  ORF Transcript_14971/g.28792 Transcript_14971/m.28792 type:complete len:244 (-) Transcript_14971:135-866(-)